MIRPASARELPVVMNVLDGGALEVDADRVRDGIDDDRVLIAADGDRVLGALLLTPEGTAGTAEIEAVAVRRARRGQGLGTALVRAAADRHDRLVAGFDERVRPFWTALGFEIEPGDRPGRYRGTLNVHGSGTRDGPAEFDPTGP